MKEEEKQRQQQEYNEYVKQVTPTRNLAWAMCRAFIVGGIICIIGQLILNTAKNMGHGRQLVQSEPDFSEYFADRAEYLPDLCKMGRGRRARADYRVRKQRGRSGD